MAEKKVKVEVRFTESVSYAKQVEMTRAEYSDWTKQLDAAKGYGEKERLANKLFSKLGFDREDNWLDSDELELDDFEIQEDDEDEEAA